ncbi:MAG: twin-arginine translocase TatA/TatE family subunit [Bacillota bacterium]|jgi:sec-independent protein translocase protein TatA|uniref:twin-arginine translocase TatA/TatE family subunit n=1 Tax=Fictibacillus TaxID=1329200 RepID=UPI0018CFE2EA|nr:MULTISPECIES: twin-arginine translocase TatA/TatE family subunit [unclassified Fictibacillus]MBH0157153.1 twin-arginine translocase TatA/TatE family subunit [Fictibacillus sp. 5RED26]MBH0159474.1 twin-arginine translocase TatA/TatE family subunit [Fictibacillus sp. 26RED30]MBH0163727.1 twin-arginine translocase TatA/TatE family subunit [Fictibacillus sp. 7GRE50]MBH0169647.1 twin-arginine translocase TatA/TatE family subunit [Fictibacillus sp. 18YEL24]MBH0174147.1 twin-arginine translocase T
MLGPGSLVLVGAAALIVFGPKKLPELGKAVGATLREFKKSTNELMDEDERKTQNNKD